MTNQTPKAHIQRSQQRYNRRRYYQEQKEAISVKLNFLNQEIVCYINSNQVALSNINGWLTELAPVDSLSARFILKFLITSKHFVVLHILSRSLWSDYFSNIPLLSLITSSKVRVPKNGKLFLVLLFRFRFTSIYLSKLFEN